MKAVERRRLGGKLPPGSEQLLHSELSYTGLTLTAAHAPTESVDESCHGSEEEEEEEGETSHLSEGFTTGKQFPAVIVFISWIKRDIWSLRDVWVGSVLEWMSKN